MGVVVEAPFRAKHQHDVAAHRDVSAANDEAGRGCHDGGAFLRKNVHALVGDGLAPGVVLEGVRVVVFGGGTGDGDGEGLGEEEAEEEGGEKYYT